VPICTTTFSFSTLDNLLMLYFALVRFKLEYASVTWNSVMITVSNKPEWKKMTLCHNRFFQDMQYHYDNLLETLNLLTLHNRCCHFDALFLINVFSGTKCCPPVLKIFGLRVPNRNVHNFNMFTCSSTHCPLAWCVSATNAICKLIDILGTPVWVLKA
jgi:hypothetical protein